MSLDELHESEKGLTPEQRSDYDMWLIVVTHREQTGHAKYRSENPFNYPEGYPVALDTRLIWHATVEQKQEALSKVL